MHGQSLQIRIRIDEKMNQRLMPRVLFVSSSNMPAEEESKRSENHENDSHEVDIEIE